MSERTLASGIKVYCNYDKICDVTELIPNPKNPNNHPDNQIALLSKIIKNQGWRQPITISSRSGFIVKGHGRLESALLLGVENVPIEYQHYDNEASEYADLIADNRIAELSQRNQILLDELLQGETFEDFDIELTGFDLTTIGDTELDVDAFFEEQGNDIETGKKEVRMVTCPECGHKFEI